MKVKLAHLLPDVGAGNVMQMGGRDVVLPAISAGC